MGVKRFSVPESDIRASVMGDSYEGICLSCGATQSGVEPDARGYRCEACGDRQVMGLEQALLEDRIDLEVGE